MNRRPTEKQDRTFPGCRRLRYPAVSRFLTGCLCLIFLLNASGREVALRIIQTSDLHGSLDHGRLTRTAALVERETLSGGGPEKTLRIDCGDLIQGSYAMTLPEGRALMFQVLNLLKFDVFIPGNHDFEFGSGILLPLLRQFRGAVLALNLDWPGSPVRPWQCFRRNDLKIAVIGIAYPSLDRMFMPEVLGRARPLSVAEQLDRIIPEVMRVRPDVIILAVHAGDQTRFGPGFTLYDLIRKYPQIDLVLCGHSHQAEAGAALGRSSWRLQPLALAQGIGIADILFDTEKKQIVSLKTRIASIDHVPEHAGIKKLVKTVRGNAYRHGLKPAADLPFALRPPEKNETASALTELYGKAIMNYTGAEIVFYGVNSRFQTGPGILNYYQLYRLMPYADHPVAVELTADEIRRILTEQLAIKRRNGMYQAPCGIRFTASRRNLRTITFDPTGQPLESGRLYSTAFSSYVFSGSGRCPVLHEIVKNKKYRFWPQTTYEAVTAYLMKNYPVKPK